jgi:hypothetical protein
LHTLKINIMGYKPSFKWTDELAIDFAKISIKTFMNGNSVESTLVDFKKYHEQKKREDRIKRVLVGKRGMNEDGSRFYYDNRGVKWTLKRIEVDNFTFYRAESEKNESVQDKFLSDVYLRIDKKAEGESITKNNFEEILK